MGFGFNLFFIFILIPLTGILLALWFFSRKTLFGKILGIIWLGVSGLAILSGITQKLTAKTVLDKEDYYGEYVINREFFKGKQANWQYNHFRFEIFKNDSIYFYETENAIIIKTHKGKIRATKPYNSARLIIDMEEPVFHILNSNPTTYRSAWDFYLVFESPNFGNMFFKKGKWKFIE